MPVVTKEQLKTWFSNLKKPPEGEFWSWIDSFYHKMEGIAISAITGLTEALQKKADLIDGVVPEDQLPFSVVTSEVITLGTVSLTDNVLNLAVHSSGANKVRVKGKTITRTFENNWNTTPIADNGVKVIRGYAVRNEDDFFISEGEELLEFTLPEIPEDALQLFIVTITNAGATIDTGGEGGFKTKAESGWKSLVFTSNLPRWIVLNSDESVFDIIAENGATPLISGLLTKGGKWIYPGKEYTLFNASGIDVIIRRNDVRPPFNPLAIANYLTFPVGADIIIKPGEYFRFKIKGTELVVLKFASDIDFSLYALDADLDAEIVNRAIADLALDGKITTEKNRNDSQDSAIAGNTAAIATKLTKPVAPDNIAERVINADGSTSPKGNFSRTLQVEIASNTTAQEDWKGKLILVTSSCTITIPGTLSDSWGIEVATLSGVTLTLAITTPKTWLFGTPATIGEKSVLTIAQRGNTNSIALFGL